MTGAGEGDRDADRVDDGPDEAPAIQALDDRTVQRIAAGEVVERPASVVKELVENSLDADASRVSVAVERGGKDGIRVRDDGAGMTAAELDLAVREHHTSKIGDIEDLESGVGTLGFRGEALYAVGAVSRLTVRSKPRGGDVGHEIAVEGGEIGEVRPAGCPEGTTVEVEDLFYSVPARRKFLKTDATEFDHVNTVVTQYALANPDVAVSLDHDGREVFATEGNGDLRSAVLSVYGREVAESMVEVEWDAGDGDDSPVSAVTGLVSHPETTRSTRDYLSTFVNDRYVTAGLLREAVLDAYGGQLASDRYPFAVLFVAVDPAEVDVNVHPRKLEVRFDDDPGVQSAVEAAVREALLDHGLVRSSAPRGRSQADEAAVSPEGQAGRSADSEEVVGGAGTAHETESGVAERRRAREPSRTQTGPGDRRATDDDGDGGTNPAPDSDLESEPASAPNGDTDSRSPTDGDSEDPSATAGSRPDAAAEDWSVDLSGGAGTPEAGGSGRENHPGDDTGNDSRPSPRAWQTDESRAEREAAVGDRERSETTSGSADGDADPDHRFAEPTAQHTLGGETAEAGGDFDSLPSMRVLGQLHDTYVVAETDSGLVLVDQHAADERVNYERLQREFAEAGAAQALAAPVTVDLTAREAELFREYREALAELGFEADLADDRTVEVRAVPAVFDAALSPDLVREVVTAFVSDEAEGGESAIEDAADELLADLACYPSVTGNTSLTEGSVAHLLRALDDCENPYACPHGRPVIIEVGLGEIGDRFERDYPGHGGRRRKD